MLRKELLLNAGDVFAGPFDGVAIVKADSGFDVAVGARLYIDGKLVATFTADQVLAGVQYKQIPSTAKTVLCTYDYDSEDPWVITEKWENVNVITNGYYVEAEILKRPFYLECQVGWG